MCGPSVWNALYVRLPAEKYLTLQHRTPHVVRVAAQGSCYRRIEKWHASRGAEQQEPMAKMAGDALDAGGMLFSFSMRRSPTNDRSLLLSILALNQDHI